MTFSDLILVKITLFIEKYDFKSKCIAVKML